MVAAIPTHACRCTLLAACAGSSLLAQADDARRAQRLVRQLELPEQVLTAARELSTLGPVATAPLRASLQDPRPAVVIACLWASTGLHGDLESLRAPIQALLRHEHQGVARAAMHALVALDGQGLTLAADYQSANVYAVNAQAVSTPMPGAAFNMAMAAERLPDGNLMVCAYGLNRVVELDATGKEVWSFGGLESPSDAERLPNGNTLIADSGGLRVVEVDRTGKEVWAYKGDIRPIDADRLPNGHTLISSYQANGVIEVDRDGRIVWQFESKNARDADLLPDGTLLLTLCDEKRIVCVDRDKKVRRQWQLDFEPNDAELLPEGGLLVGGEGKVLELDAAERATFVVPLGYAGHVARLGRRVAADASPAELPPGK